MCVGSKGKTGCLNIIDSTRPSIHGVIHRQCRSIRRFTLGTPKKKFGQKELQHVFSSYVVRLRVKYYVVNIFCFGFVGDLV